MSLRAAKVKEDTHHTCTAVAGGGGRLERKVSRNLSGSCHICDTSWMKGEGTSQSTDTLELGEEVAQHILNMAEASAGWTPGETIRDELSLGCKVRDPRTPPAPPART